ncbi:MAG: glycosyltransferase family A protein [Oceanicaulis sp.]
MTPLIDEHANVAGKAAGAARLSVLIPFYKDDPRPLLANLAHETPAEVELLLFDDGAPDAALNAAVREAVDDLNTPARLLSAKTNLGRSAARNRLGARAKGDWLLFLDADMAVEPGFLAGWLALIARTGAAALFGGYAPVETRDPALRLHAALAQASDVKAAHARSSEGAFAVCSSNLAVSRAAFCEVPFDEGYAGWGWEDVDWALSFAQRFAIAHVDHPARHGGLERAGRLIAKFSRSGANFARLLSRHPEYRARKGAQLAFTLNRTRLALPARLVGAAAARAPLPMKVRVLGLKLYRAGVGAKAL